MGRPALPDAERLDVVPVRLRAAEVEELDALADAWGVSRGRAVARLVAEARNQAKVEAYSRPQKKPTG